MKLPNEFRVLGRLFIFAIRIAPVVLEPRAIRRVQILSAPPLSKVDVRSELDAP